MNTEDLRLKNESYLRIRRRFGIPIATAKTPPRFVGGVFAVSFGFRFPPPMPQASGAASAPPRCPMGT